MSYYRGLGTMPGSEHVVKARFAKAAIMVATYVIWTKMFQPKGYPELM